MQKESVLCENKPLFRISIQKQKMSYFFFLLMSLKALQAIGTAIRKEQTSAHAWHISTPNSPKKRGRTKMSGMKKRPLLAAATRLARIGLRMVCISMLVSTMVATRGKLMTCHFKATEPTATTSGSLRNSSMIGSAKRKPMMAQATRNTVPHLMQK